MKMHRFVRRGIPERLSQHWLRPTLVTLLTVASVVVAKADFLQMTGDLGGFLNSVSIPGAGSEAFVEPSAGDRDEFRRAIVHLLQRQYAMAAALADGQGYDLIEFSDIFSDLQPYYVLVERTASGFRGLGTYAFNPAWTRALSIQAPHAHNNDDFHTRNESVAMFLELRASFLQIAGTSRNANSQVSACQSKFLIADVAHNVANFFHETSSAVAEMFPLLVSVSVHGLCQGPTTTVSHGLPTHSLHRSR